jgi:hypothetical protein
MKKNILLLIVVFVLAIIFLSPADSEVAEGSVLQSNILQNPGYEEPYSNGVAQGWAPQHAEVNSNPKPAECSDYYTVKPKWSPELASAGLILDGGRSQHIGNQFDTWDAVVMQTVSVNPGSSYRFSFWATGRASNDQYPAPSDTSVNLRVQAGIDPIGRGNFVANLNEIVWGSSGSPHMSGGEGNWQQFSVEATAAAGQITVFARANLGGAGQCRKHLDVWFDKAELIGVGPAPTNTPPPLPTSPPRPVVTNTPVPPPPTSTPEVPPTDTPLPTPVPTNTAPPPQGGVICVNAFADNNSNGQRDSDEGYMAGVTFTIAQDDQVVAQGVSTGTSTAVCFEGIDPGTYLVAQVVPRNLEMTTAGNATIEVSDGSTTSLEFGSKIKSDLDGENISAEPSQTPESSGSVQGGDNSGDEGPNILALVGLGAIFLAILMLGFLIFLLLRQQRAS